MNDASLRKTLLVGLLLILSTPTQGWSQSPPGTDIWVFRLLEGGTALDLDSGLRATDHPGYDNQPQFLPGGRYLLFTSIDEMGEADILRYDLASGEISNVTQTAPESEYSATPVPGGNRISVIRVEADSLQRLWSLDLHGRDARVLLPEIAPVGYHAWIDTDRLALFVLGSPATLQVASISKGTGVTMARDIGRSLFRIPDTKRVSFVQWGTDGKGEIRSLDPETGETKRLAPLLEGNEYYAWTPSGTLLMGQGSKLYRTVPGSGNEWALLADLAAMGVEGISRIAVSPEGDRIAIVGVGE